MTAVNCKHGVVGSCTACMDIRTTDRAIARAVVAERERILMAIEAVLERQRREQHHHLGADIERAICRLREGDWK